MKKIGVLFRNNIRLHDNKVIDAANKEGNILFPLYFHDTCNALGSEFNIRNIGPYRAKFICESVNTLKTNLNKLGSDLAIVRGENIDLICKYAEKNGLSEIYVQSSLGDYENKMLKHLKSQLEKLDISLREVWDHTLVHKDDLPFEISQMPQVYTQFRKSVEKNSSIQDPTETPHKINSIEIEKTQELDIKKDFGYTEVEIDDRAAIEFIGGEDAALERLEHYFWETQSLSEYKKTRNGLIGADYSSKFSAYLSMGCISPRYIYHQVKKYEQQVTKNSSTYWLMFELLWRDFFQFIFLENPVKFFDNYHEASNNLNNEKQMRKFNKWKQGTLGVDFVDANMREIAHTGFMSNRGRQIVASYLVNDLKVDWRLGAKYFESMLVDYDIASNWGNWAYIAGVGNDPRDNRYFNIEKQARNYDPNQEYRKLWLS